MNDPSSPVGQSHAFPPVTDAGRPETPPLPDVSPTLAGHPVPDGPRPLPRLPGYEVIEEVGRGGMGVVFLARQRALNRVVALKMILAAEQASAEARVRFLGEAEAIARLRHPNIVAVHEFGTCDGCPFFSMEYIDGGSLADRLRGQPLPAAAAADLVETLAGAVQHAHSRGVIHRDLKPGNVLVAGQASPPAPDAQGQAGRLSYKITDFGLAKRVEMPTGMTQSGALVGTPSYMAPEQARAEKDVGPAADVYALGAILYECLTGRPPFKAATTYETLSQVLNDDPVPVRQLQPGTPRELETICLKCLEKDPRRRYASAADLAADLRAHRDGRPILARPVGPWGRAVKWARRRPAQAGLVAVSAVALLALAAGGVVHNHRLDRARRDAERDRDDAEESRRLAVAAIDELLTQVGQDRLKNLPEMEPVRKALLEKALTFYRRLLQRPGADDRVRREVGRAYRRVGDINLLLGHPDEAEAAYQAGIELHDGPADAADRAACHDGLGRLYHSQRRPELAIRAWQAAADLLGSSAAAADRAGLAAALAGQGAAHRDMGRFDRAGEAFRAALAIWDALPGDHRQRQAALHNELGQLDAALGRYQAARQRFDRAIALLEPVVSRDPDDPALAETRATLATAYRNLGTFVYWYASRTAEAERELDKARRIWEQLAARHPYVVAYLNDLAATHVNLGNLFGGTGRPAESRLAHQRALEIMAPVLRRYDGISRYHFTAVRARWGLAYVQQGRLDRAEKLFADVEPVLRRLVRDYPDNPEHLSLLARLHHSRGYGRENAGKWPEAVEAFEAARAAREALIRQFPGMGAHSYDLTLTLLRLQNAYLHQKRRDRAAEAGRRAVEVAEALVKDHPESAGYLNLLGWTLLEGHSLDRCLAVFDRAEAVVLAALRRDPADPRAHELLRGVFDGRGYATSKLPPAEGVDYAVEALARSRQRVEQEPGVNGLRTQLGWDAMQLSRLLAPRGRLAEAEMVLREAVATMRPVAGRRPVVPEDSCHLAVLLCELGGVLRARGRVAEAAATFEEAVGRQSAAVQGRAGNLYHRSTLLALYGKLCDVHLAGGRHRLAAEVAQRLAEEPVSGMPELAFEAACWHARCAARAAADEGLAAAERDRLSAAYAARALALLREAARKGYRNLERVNTDPALAAVRQHKDFAAVVRSMQEK